MFLKFHPKNAQIRHFWSQIYRFFFLHKTLKIDKFKTVDSKMTIIFLNSSPKIPDIRQFWSQFKRNLFLRQTLEFNKFDAAVFKYGKRFSKLLNKTTKQGILSPNTYLPQVFIFFFLIFSFFLFFTAVYDMSKARVFRKNAISLRIYLLQKIASRLR